MIILAPAMHLTSRLRFPIKFAILAVIVLIPLTLLGLRVINQINTSIDTIRSEQVGQRYLLDVTPVLRLSMLQRALTNRVLSGDATGQGDLAANQEKLQEAFSKLEATDRELGTVLETGDRVARLRSDAFQLIEQSKGSAEQAAIFDAWNDQIGKTLNFVYLISATSGMVLDEDYNSLFMIDQSTLRLPRQINVVGQLRGLASGLREGLPLSTGTRSSLRLLLKQELQIRQELLQSLTLLRRNEPALTGRLQAPIDSALQALDSFRSDLDRVLADTGSTITGVQGLAAKGNAVVADLYKAQDVIDRHPGLSGS